MSRNLPEAGRRILILDDGKLTVKLIRNIMEREGYRVVMPSVGSEEAHKAISQNPDLVIVNTSVPGPDEYEAFQEFEQVVASKRVPVIFLTGEFSSWESDDRFQVKTTFNVHKPFAHDELLKTVTLALESATVSKMSVKPNCQSSDTY